jgi:hypothetical protein
MRCQDLQEWIPDFLAGNLTPENSRLLESHLAGCAGCRAQLEQARSIWSALGELPEREPGPGLRGRFYAMLEEEKRLLVRVEKRSVLERIDRWIDSWWPRRPAVQMATAVALLVAGVLAGAGLKPESVKSDEIARLRDDVQQMRQMVSLSLLERDSSSERLRGVNWSTQIAEPSGELLASLQNTLESDPSPNVRLAAVDALAVFHDEPGVMDALTHALSRESSPVVQIELIDMMTAIQQRKALEALKNFIEMKNVEPEVKDHARERISQFM